MSELNPDHPVSQSLHHQWHKILAIVMEKLGVPEVLITTEDLKQFEQRQLAGEQMPVVLAHDTKAGLKILVLPLDQARAYAAKVGTKL